MGNMGSSEHVLMEEILFPILSSAKQWFCYVYDWVTVRFCYCLLSQSSLCEDLFEHHGSCFQSKLSLLRAKLSPLEAKLSFLQQVDPSPLCKDFMGDISFRMKGSDEPVQAHRFMLASKSSVFKKMMEIDMNENLFGEIHIEGISAAVVQAAVNFMYTGNIVFNDKIHPEEALKLAHQYDILWLKDVCETELTANITPLNVVDMLSISYEFGTEKLMDKAKKFITNRPDILGTLLDGTLKSRLAMRNGI